MLFQCYLGTANGRDTLIKELDQALVQIFCVFFYAYELPSWSSFLCVIHSCIYLFGCTESQLQHVGSFVVACRIQFPENESNLGPAASGAQSQPLHHQGSPFFTNTCTNTNTFTCTNSNDDHPAYQKKTRPGQDLNFIFRVK